MPRFFVHEHQHKGERYIQALLDHGHERTESLKRADFYLLDGDIMGYSKRVSDAKRRGIPTFLYPHAAIPNLAGAFASLRWCEDTKAQFVAAIGHKEIMRSIGYPYPIHSVGWSLCEIMPFVPSVKSVPSVLFGPIHPNGNGYLSSVDMDLNARAFRCLAALAQDGRIDLTVRHLYQLPANGLWEEAGVRYVCGQPDGALSEVLAADVVVSHHTLAYMAVASGVPTLMFGEEIPPRIGRSEATFEWTDKWGLFRGAFMYPLDLLTAPDPMRAIYAAMESDEAIQEWRTRMIGGAFKPDRFVKMVENYL